MLPPRMKLLYITTLRHAHGWLAEAFAADSATEIALEEVIGATAGMARLREETFDAVLVMHHPGVLDALDFVEGLRTGGSDDPAIVLGNETEPEMSVLSFEVGADGYCSVETTTTRSLIWTIARAIHYQQVLRENRQLVQAQQQRLAQEHQEAERLLTQQRALIQELERLRRTESRPRLAESMRASRESARISMGGALPNDVTDRYREMLRAYVIMGSGNMTHEMNRLAELLVQQGVKPQQAMQLHVEVLEELIAGLGNRSARHVMNRADLLALEVMMHLGEAYRQRQTEQSLDRPHDRSPVGPSSSKLLSATPYAPPEIDLRHHRGYA